MSTIKTFTGRVSLRNVASIRVISTSQQIKQGGFIGRSIVGAILFDVPGAIIGAATRKTTSTALHTFEAVLKDGSVVQGTATQKEIARATRYVTTEDAPIINARLVIFAVAVAALYFLAHA